VHLICVGRPSAGFTGPSKKTKVRLEITGQIQVGEAPKITKGKIQPVL